MLGALAFRPEGTRYRPLIDTMIDTTGCKYKKIKGVAERVGFEPTVRFPARSLSRRVLSTAQPPLRGRRRLNRSRALRFSAIGRSRVVTRKSRWGNGLSLHR